MKAKETTKANNNNNTVKETIKAAPVKKAANEVKEEVLDHPEGVHSYRHANEDSRKSTNSQDDSSSLSQRRSSRATTSFNFDKLFPKKMIKPNSPERSET